MVRFTPPLVCLRAINANYQVNRRLRGTQDRCGRFAEQNNLFAPVAIRPQSVDLPPRSLVTKPTEYVLSMSFCHRLWHWFMSYFYWYFCPTVLIPGRSLQPRSLWPLAYSEWGFASRHGHGCLSLVSVACRQVEISEASDHSSRGVLPGVVCLSEISKPLHWGGLGQRGFSGNGGEGWF